MGFSLRRIIDVKDFMLRPDPIRVLTEATEVLTQRIAHG